MMIAFLILKYFNQVIKKKKIKRYNILTEAEDMSHQYDHNLWFSKEALAFK